MHSPCFEEDEEIKKYIEFAAKISKKMNRKINIVYHPISANNINESKKNTEIANRKNNEMYKENNYFKNIDLSIENLNDLNQIKRLKKEDLIEILKNNPNLKFTYDIGHEIVDEIKPNLNQKILKDRINNIHIHTHKNKEDHYPILNFQNEEELYVQRTLKEIQLENYQGNVVMEYALDYIEGKNFEIKLKNYIESAKIITTALENKQT